MPVLVIGLTLSFTPGVNCISKLHHPCIIWCTNFQWDKNV